MDYIGGSKVRVVFRGSPETSKNWLRKVHILQATYNHKTWPHCTLWLGGGEGGREGV